MGFDWKKTQLTDLYSITSGLSKKREEFGFGFPFLTFKEVFHNYFLPEKLEELANTDEKEQYKCSIARGDVFLTRTSEKFEELGLSSVALKDYPNATFNGFTKRLRPNQTAEQELLPEFVAFYLRSVHFRNQVLSLTNMSTRASLNNEMISKLEINYPPLSDQKRIIDLLYSIHKKVEVNNNIINTIEQLAQTLFKHWFMDFEFPNENGEPYKSSGGEMVESEFGMIPKGWGIATLGEVCDANKDSKSNGDKWEYVNYLDTANITRNYISKIQKLYTDKHKIPSRAKRIVKENDIVYSTVRPNQRHYGIIKKPEENMLVSTGFVVLTSKTSYSNDLVYIWLTQNEITQKLQSIAEQSTSTYPSIKPIDILSIKLLIPLERELVHLSSIIEKQSNLIWKNQQQNRSLIQMRDTLLPKLLSGEIEIPDEIEVTDDVPIS
ncbi:restriction endonuclease subunit S [Sporosarcina sp. FSL K6-5500]|uniref:restriction endonuclease subunit S n=1 Tax=Sporosarcina sp. FSL K6-5500 TaxID=2921558 RepID=UPI0030F8C9E7